MNKQNKTQKTNIKNQDNMQVRKPNKQKISQDRNISKQNKK